MKTLKNLAKLALIPYLALSVGTLRAQEPKDFISLIDSCEAMNLGEARKEDLLKKLEEKYTKEELKKYYTHLNEKIDKENCENGELQIRKTDLEGCYEINSYKVDFDPESICEKDKKGIVIMSISSCRPCKILYDDLKKHLQSKGRENENFNIYYVSMNKDNEGKIYSWKEVENTNSQITHSYFRGMVGRFPLTYLIKEDRKPENKPVEGYNLEKILNFINE